MRPDRNGGDRNAAVRDNGEAREESFGYRLVTSLLLFGLFAEWLLPWTGSGQWTVIYHPVPLLVIIGCILAVGLFRLPWIVSASANGTFCIVGLMWLYKGADQGAFEWLLGFPALLGESIGMMLRGGLWAMTGELRTLLLFVGWALLVPAVQALMWMRQAALGTAAVTIVYLVALHVWLGMDVMAGVLRATAAGLLLASVVAVPRAGRILDNGWNRLQRLNRSWLAGSLFLTLIIVGCAMLVSGDKETEQRPAGWTVEMTDRLQQGIASLGGERRAAQTVRSTLAAELGRGFTGYGFDDSRLGMPLSDSNEVLFAALSGVRAYWRGEAKTVYDGSGWSNAAGAMTMLPVRAEGAAAGAGAIRGYGAAEDAGRKAEPAERGPLVAQTVIWRNPAPAMPLFASGLNGEVTELIAADPRRKLGTYFRNEAVDALYAATETVKAERYTIRSFLPVTDPKELRRMERVYETHRGVAASQMELDAELRPYLQLPRSLPERVAALAAEVGGGGVTSQYDRVKAMEQYLKNTYPYTKSESEPPPAGADFVDHFLFEQKQGYCVHFSTAMVIMLRTQGIPARWVKGFAPGEIAGGGGDYGVFGVQTADVDPAAPAGDGAAGAVHETVGAGAERVYEIRGSDAHAWVEVYFPGAGWVPFDPTPDFDGIAAIGAAGAGIDGAGSGPAAASPDAAASGGEMSFANLAGRLKAAEQAASLIARAAGELAQTARSAVEGAAAAPAAAAAAGGGAALALTGAALAVAQRGRLRLRLALRRYGAAYARAVAYAAAGAVPPPETPGAAEGLASRRDAKGGARSHAARNGASGDASAVMPPSNASGARNGDASPDAPHSLNGGASGVNFVAARSVRNGASGSVNAVVPSRNASGARSGVVSPDVSHSLNGDASGHATVISARSGVNAAVARHATERQRNCLIDVAQALVGLLRRPGGLGGYAWRSPAPDKPGRPAANRQPPGEPRTLRELARALFPSMNEAQRTELRRLIQWTEQAIYGGPHNGHMAPTPEELRQACRILLRKQERPGERKTSRASSDALPQSVRR